MYKLDIDAKKLNFEFADIVKASEIATKNTLNTVAFLSIKNVIKEINQNFTIRNTFTQIKATFYCLFNVIFKFLHSFALRKRFLMLGTSAKSHFYFFVANAKGGQRKK